MCKTRELIINNELGLHARPATYFVSLTADYDCEVSVTNLNNGTIANGKSIISMLMLNAPKGTRLKLEVSGDLEDELIDKLSALIESGFNET